MNVRGRRIEWNRFYGTVHCLAGGRKRCNGKPEYLIHIEYLKRVTAKDGSKHQVLTAANKPACKMHTALFADKFNLLLPPSEQKPSR